MIQSLICLYSPPLLCSIKGWLCTELLISMFLIFTLYFWKQIFHELFPSLLVEKKNSWNKFYDFADFYDVDQWLTVVFGLASCVAFFLY